MKLIKNKLTPEIGCYLKEIDDIGCMNGLEFIYPNLYDVVYVSKSIDNIDKAKSIYEEIDRDEYNNLYVRYKEAQEQKELEEE